MFFVVAEDKGRTDAGDYQDVGSVANQALRASSLSVECATKKFNEV